MRIAKIEEQSKPAYEAQIEDFDPDSKKGSFEATQFNKAGETLSVPEGSFTLSIEGKVYRCRMLVATHFSIVQDVDVMSRQVAAALE